MIVGVIGLGLIGGSMSLALKKNSLVKKVLGYDFNLIHCEDAMDLHIVDEIVPFKELLEVDVLFLAIPVESILKLMSNLKNINKNCTIIDLGSTKEAIIKGIPPQIRKNFIAAHPMAGKEKFGPKAAVDDLFYKMVVVLCDIEDSSKLHQERAKALFKNIGMKIVYMNSKEHDKHAAFISHMPHLISFALANSVMNQEDPRSILALAAGGFRDMSRTAKSSPNMWSDIFKQNRENVLKTVESFEKELQMAKELIINDKWAELKEWMGQATTLHKII